jgi:hypothetical protein
LIKALGLSATFAEKLRPYVREKYRELWDGASGSLAAPVERRDGIAG